jgi:hypothetical protein
MVQTSLAAEQRINSYGKPAWSVALDQSRKNRSLFRKCLSMMRTGMDLTAIIATQNNALDERLECFTAIQEAKTDMIDNIATFINLRELEFKKNIQH